MFAIFAGGYMLANPQSALQALTVVLAIIFAIEGISAIIFALRLPPLSGAGWIIFDGAVSLLVAGLIWAKWPSSAEWAIGLIIGIKLFIDGVAITAVGVTVKNIGSAVAEAAGGPEGL
jgi:uncharacterized membrane protein HdeD (DUF308 family)